MFSAVKFVVAGVIVALFGGFLLAGVLTTQQGDEMAPAAVTESPSPTTSVRTDILPGVSLAVEEAEPGVFRVVDDGVRDLAKANNLDIVAGHDGGIWLLRPQRFVRLGDEEWHAWPRKKPDLGDFDVAPNGTVWAMDDGRLYSVDRGSDDWTRTTGDAPDRIWVTSDGTVWAKWGLTIGYLGADGWQVVGEGFASNSGVFVGHFVVSDRGEVWAVDWSTGLRSRDLQHLVDGAWRTYDGVEDLPERVGGADRAAVGQDGTLWGTTRRGGKFRGGRVFRFDGTEWMTFAAPDWNQTAWGGARAWGEPHVAPDGSLWVPPRHGDSRVEERSVCDHGIDSVARFDGVTWSRYLRGFCVEEMDIAADGSVWLLTGTGSPDESIGPRSLYVIAPEAVAATD